MRRLSLPLLILAVLLYALPARAQVDRSIATSGEATVYVVPDKVVVALGIESFDNDLDKAKAANETAAARLVQAITNMGIEKKDVATDNLQVEIHRRYDNGRYLDIDGYFVRRGYAITLKDVKQFEKLIDTALKNGCNQIQNISFMTTDLRKYRDQARQMAIKAAKEKAVALAKELDCAVGKPRTISESGGGAYFGGYRWGYSGGGMSQNAVQSVSGPPDTGENLPLGQIAVTASVSVTFDLQ
jgi:uncharacterized protein